MRACLYSRLFLIIFLVALFVPGSLFADTLLISPSSGTYAQGQTFSARIMVTSQIQAVNAISATLSYPTDKLQVVSISKNSSILNLWVKEPSYSNSAGTLSLEGIVLNPGFLGTNGPVLTVTFKVLGTGSATLKFSAGSLLANDGYGADILKNRGTASYTLTAAQASPEKPEKVATEPAESTLSSENSDVSERKTISFAIPTWEDLYNWLLKFFSLIIPIMALVFFFIHTTKRGVANLRALRKDVHDIDRVVGQSFSRIREDVGESIHILERARAKRKLTQEEDAIIRRLRQNLVAAEKGIHQEIVRVERDIGA